MSHSPFHAGEQALQTAWGVRERMETVGRAVIRTHMPEPHRELFEKLGTLWLGTVDDEGQPWATLLTGTPGFVDSPDPQTLRVAVLPAAGDPVARGLRPGAAIGLLGLEPHTRRRNRMNGRVESLGPDGFSVDVVQSFGNCPKYIQAREPVPQAGHQPGPVSVEGPVLSAAARALIEGADTFFIASSSGPRVEENAGQGGVGVDVSHRGGPPGFVQIQATPNGDRLSLPDYLGNAMFNTLGNLLAWPHAGLLFIDWQTGDVLQLAALAEIEQVEGDPADKPATLHRLHLRIERGWWRPAALPLSWTAPQPAPQFKS